MWVKKGYLKKPTVGKSEKSTHPPVALKGWHLFDPTSPYLLVAWLCLLLRFKRRLRFPALSTPPPPGGGGRGRSVPGIGQEDLKKRRDRGSVSGLRLKGCRGEKNKFHIQKHIQKLKKTHKKSTKKTSQLFPFKETR